MGMKNTLQRQRKNNEKWPKEQHSEQKTEYLRISSLSLYRQIIAFQKDSKKKGLKE